MTIDPQVIGVAPNYFSCWFWSRSVVSREHLGATVEPYQVDVIGVTLVLGAHAR